ncbi:sulfatase-like hydrolase/transferase [Ruficoccus amylovorans]|uniref:Sulfatase-like hydrolase/transferase n=2 Tax=Ruficoccus amylovorans TaxID=1804625 RepID=A0A842HF12_9BACT|nr:sulfatase-like hydrolase/transferase [Ruficoccus amylovorans]
MADDLGYADIGAHGNVEFPTPNLDRLAGMGMRFTQGYVTGPVCGPSRAGLITGRNQERFGFEGHPGPKDTWGLPLDEDTLPASLKAAGYRTALFGKWHLGSEPGYRPLDRGFDEFYGFLSGMHDYFKQDDPNWGLIVEGEGSPAELPQYLTFELADRTAAFIRRQAQEDSPFFVWLSFNAPHTPMQAPRRYLDKAQHIEGKLRSTYAAMVMAMDDAIATVINALEESGVLDDTVIVFMSDNGGAMLDGGARNGARNDPLRGSKAQLWEGGVRVPFFIIWPEQIPAGQVRDEIVSSLDLYPTFTALANATTPDKLEGVDLSALLQGEPMPELFQRELHWRFYGTQKAVRRGDLKWVRVSGDGGLYGMSKSVREDEDLSETHGPEAEALEESWVDWNSVNPKIKLHQQQMLESESRTGQSKGSD